MVSMKHHIVYKPNITRLQNYGTPLDRPRQHHNNPSKEVHKGVGAPFQLKLPCI
jgi:hypothetical protein